MPPWVVRRHVCCEGTGLKNNISINPTVVDRSQGFIYKNVIFTYNKKRINNASINKPHMCWPE
jgi:hypothetical protein